MTVATPVLRPLQWGVLCGSIAVLAAACASTDPGSSRPSAASPRDATTGPASPRSGPVGLDITVGGQRVEATLTDSPATRDLVAQLTREMDAASANLEFEKAAELRDAVAQIEATMAA